MRPRNLSAIARIMKNEDGSVGVLFGLLIVPIIGLMALAVDYSRVIKVQERMQASLDGAILAAMKDPSLTTSERQDIAAAFFKANFKEASLKSEVKPVFTIGEDGLMTAKAKADVRTPFGQFVAIPYMEANGKSTVQAEQGTGQKVEVSMMIDLTGSMGSTRNGQTKISGLKTAAQDLLDILYPTGDNDNVRVAVAPMADYVNAGDLASEVTGLPDTGAYSAGDNLSQTKQGPFSGSYSGYYGSNQPSGSQFGATSGSGSTYSNQYCTAGNEYETYGRYNYVVGELASYYTPGAIYAYNWYSKQWLYHGRSNNGYWQYYYHSENRWILPYRNSECSNVADQSGKLVTCVTERTDSSTRYTDDAPSMGQYVGPYNQSSSGRTNKLNYSSDGKCYVAGRELPAVLPLTSSKSTLEDFFDNATVGGATPGHLGHAWAWYMLSPKWSSVLPASSKPADYTDTGTRKVAIIMTDGEYNTQYSNVDSRTQALALCENMKTAGVTVYTIGFGFSTSATPGDGSAEGNTKQMLSQCSSGENHYYFPYDSNALRQVFATIGDGIVGNSSTVSHLKLKD
ncbi:MAG: pilus assembly protein TadG-related protein [Hyphomicrobium sp.]